MEDNKLDDTYESGNLIIKIYFSLKIRLAIKLAKLKKNDVILDFGCGGGWLEKKLRNYNIAGYDVNPKKTFIKDYQLVNPDKIFALDVFEHVPKAEIGKILKNFKNMSSTFDLIVSIPTENFISRKARKLLGKSEIPKEHITKYSDILELLNENFRLKKKVNFFTVGHTFVFEHST